jgi:hypothetical protein
VSYARESEKPLKPAHSSPAFQWLAADGWATVLPICYHPVWVMAPQLETVNTLMQQPLSQLESLLLTTMCCAAHGAACRLQKTHLL